jgi:hypothetical protein
MHDEKSLFSVTRGRLEKTIVPGFQKGLQCPKNDAKRTTLSGRKVRTPGQKGG